MGVGEDGHAFAARPSDHGEPRFVSQFRSPRREAGAGDENGHAHHHRLDDHLAGETTCCVENLCVSHGLVVI